MASTRKQYGAIRFANFKQFDEPRRVQLIDRKERQGQYNTEGLPVRNMKVDSEGRRAWSF